MMNEARKCAGRNRTGVISQKFHILMLLLTAFSVSEISYGQDQSFGLKPALLAGSNYVELGLAAEVLEQCSVNKLGTWIGYDMSDEIESRFALTGPGLIKGTLDGDEVFCGYSEEKVPITPPMSVTVFDNKGNTKTMEVTHYQWEVGCDTSPEFFPGAGSPFELIFSTPYGKKWGRLDRTAAPDDVPPQIWASLEKRIEDLIKDLKSDRRSDAPPWKIAIAGGISRKLNVISASPSLLAITLVQQVIVEQEGKVYDKGSVGVSQIVEAVSYSPLAEWPVAYMAYPFSEILTEDSPFLGEYGNGDFRVVLMGDWMRLYAVSLGPRQEILTRASSAHIDCE